MRHPRTHLLPPLLASSALPRHTLAARHLAGHLLDLAVPVARGVAVLGRGSHLGLCVRLVLLARRRPGVRARDVADCGLESQEDGWLVSSERGGMVS